MSPAPELNTTFAFKAEPLAELVNCSALRFCDNIPSASQPKLRRETSFLDMDELCHCKMSSDKNLFLIPEDGFLLSQENCLAAVHKSVPASPVIPPVSGPVFGPHRQEGTFVDADTSDDDHTCCFEKALHCLAMVDEPNTSAPCSDSDDDSQLLAPSPKSRSASPPPAPPAPRLPLPRAVVTTETLLVPSVPSLVAVAQPAAHVEQEPCIFAAQEPAVFVTQTLAGPGKCFHHKTGGPCDHCGATESPQWRRGPPSKPTLCNACGTRYRRTNQLGAPGNTLAGRAERAAAAQNAASVGGFVAGAANSAGGMASAAIHLPKRTLKREVKEAQLDKAAKRPRTATMTATTTAAFISCGA